MIPSKQHWSDISEETMSDDAIGALHLPAENFSITPHTFQAGQSFMLKSAQAFVLYVLDGACKTTLDGMVLQLSAGELVFLDKGGYQFKSLDKGGDKLRLVQVSSR